MPGLLKNCYSSYSPFCTKKFRLSRKFENKTKRNENVFFFCQSIVLYFIILLNIKLLQLYLVPCFDIIEGKQRNNIYVASRGLGSARRKYMQSENINFERITNSYRNFTHLAIISPMIA